MLERLYGFDTYDKIQKYIIQTREEWCDIKYIRDQHPLLTVKLVQEICKTKVLLHNVASTIKDIELSHLRCGCAVVLAKEYNGSPRPER